MEVENAFKNYFEERGFRVSADELEGDVQLLDRDSLVDFLRNLVTDAEGAATKTASTGSGLSSMLDDYMRQNADLRMKEQTARRRAQEAEIELKMAREQTKKSPAGGGAAGVPATLLKPHLDLDLSEGDAVFEEVNESLSVLEAALNEIEDMEGSWDIVTRVAELRSDFNFIKEDYAKARDRLQGLSKIPQTGSVDPERSLAVVESAVAARGRIAEAKVLSKSIGFLQGVLGLG